MNNKSVKLYYTILIAVIAVKVVATIFTNGLAVHHGKKVAQLQIQKTNLHEQQLRLNSELSARSSLTQIAQTYDVSEYTPITSPIVLTAGSTVASN